MAGKGARDDRGLERSVRKGERRLEVMERGLLRIERKLVKAQVLLTETAVRASDLEERVRALRAKLGLPGAAAEAADVDGDGVMGPAGSAAIDAVPLEVAVGSDPGSGGTD